MERYFDLILGLHILAVIAWMAGLLYLPRLFVYHTRAPAGSQMDETFQMMERRLNNGIMTPAMIVAWILGLAMLDILTHHFRDWRLLLQPWLATKLIGVVIQTGYHHFLSRNRKRFAKDQNIHSEKFWRMVNEIPFVVAIVMVLAVTTKFAF